MKSLLDPEAPSLMLPPCLAWSSPVINVVRDIIFHGAKVTFREIAGFQEQVA
jgi:hypothetical protein